MFISEEVEIFSGDYLNNPFGSKKDKRIDNWLSILKKLPLIKEVKVNLQNQVSVDFQCEDMLEIEELILQLLPWRKGPFKLNDINIDSEWDSSKKWIIFK